MGIHDEARTTSMAYVSDRGDRYEISQMEISHLVNVIGHHQEQIHTLQLLRDDTESATHLTALYERQKMIEQVITVLACELAKRNVDITQYLPDYEEDKDATA